VKFRGRHSDRFYWFATRHLVNEVALHRMMNGNGGSVGRMAVTYAKSRLAAPGCT